jgi:hypothetical protein
MGWTLSLPSLESYLDYADVFSPKRFNTLPDCVRMTHAIELEPGAKPYLGPIYHLSTLELQVLRDYLVANEAEGWIRKSKSPAGAPILLFLSLMEACGYVSIIGP